MSSEHPGPVEEPLIEEVEQESAGLPLRERYGLVLGLILVAYVLTGFDQSRIVVAINTVVWATVLLATLWSPGLPRNLRRIGLAATVVVGVSALSFGVMATSQAHGWRSLLLAIAQAAALLAILNRILRHETVSFQTVMGGVAAYALIAFVMSSAYMGMDELTDTPFLNGVEDFGDYAYFSFITLTTVGYGDITPASELAKRLVVVEAFVGQVFIITFVARLVSLWGQPLHRNHA